MTTTLHQRLEALENANAIRLARAQITRDIHAAGLQESRLAAVEVLLDPPGCCESMAVYDLLRACQRVGRGHAARMCARARVPERKPLGELTERQRDAVAKRLRGFGR